MRQAILCSLAILASGVASAAERPSFDAASVKLASPDVRPPFRVTGGPGTNDPARFSAPSILMISLLTRAFGIREDQLVGPAWLQDFQNPGPSYTVIATMPPDTTQEQFQKMLQNLLVERFHLAFHYETHKFPGYELVVDKGGPKFREITPTEVDNSGVGRDPRSVTTRPLGDDGFPVYTGRQQFSQDRPSGQERMKFQEWTMGEFALNLSPLIAASQGKGARTARLRPQEPRVIDNTGLKGKYTFVLEYYNPDMANVTPPAVFGRGNTTPDGGNGAAPVASEPGNGLPNIFTAVQKELGLRLDKTADVQLGVIVVDRVDKAPAAN